MIESIENHQPYIIVESGDHFRVISVSLIRDVANGRKIADEDDMQVIAQALLENIKDD